MNRQYKINGIKISSESNGMNQSSQDPQIVNNILGLLGQVQQKSPITPLPHDKNLSNTSYQYEIKLNITVNLKTSNEDPQNQTQSVNNSSKLIQIPKPISQLDRQSQKISQFPQIEVKQLQSPGNSVHDQATLRTERIVIEDPNKIIEKQRSQKKQVHLIYPDMFYLVDKLGQFWNQRSETSPNAFKKLQMRKKFSKYPPELVEIIDFRDRKIQKSPFEYHDQIKYHQ